MNGLYAEAYVKRKKTAVTMLAKAGLIFGAVLLIAVSLLFSGTGSVLGTIAMFLAVVCVVGLFILLPRLDVAYEYIFVDGQIDFDQISGGEKRKSKLRIDMENIEIMAPENSHQLDSFRHQQSKIKDFSSRDPEAKRYNIYMSHNGERLRIIFEPSEKMVDFARQKAPRKVFKD